MQTLNEKLRQINAELRRQREAQESILSAVGLGAAEPAGPAAAAGSGPGPAEAAAAAADGAADNPEAARDGEVASEGEGGLSGVQAAAALEALRRQAELLQRERAALEAALASPAAAHPTEQFGDQRLSIARARRQIAQCIRWVGARSSPGRGGAVGSSRGPCRLLAETGHAVPPAASFSWQGEGTLHLFGLRPGWAWGACACLLACHGSDVPGLCFMHHWHPLLPFLLIAAAAARSL